MMNIFSRKRGAVRHTWGSELAYAPTDPGQDPRHIDLIWPLCSVLDMTPGAAAISARACATTEQA